MVARAILDSIRCADRRSDYSYVVVPFTDNLGSTIATWNTATGVVDRQHYYPYGEIRQSDGLDTEVGFTGQRHDPSGLMYYQARYYDPHIGRFTQPDTIIPGGGANPAGLNRYSYVNNNPINFTDPTGHECFVGGERDGQCFEGPDGADWAMTAGEEAATVKIMTPAGVMLPDGSLQVSENIRFTKFGDLSSEQIWASHRYATDVNGVTDFAEFADQLVLDQCGCRIDFGNVSLRALWRVGSTIVVVGCIAATSGACTAVVYVIAAANVAISYVDNDIGRGSSGCQKGSFAVDVIANAMPIAAVKFTTGAAAMDGIETLNTAVHNSAGLSIGASGLDYCGLGG